MMNWKYWKLKRRTVKKLREFRYGDALDQVVLLATRSAFYLIAEQLGVDRNTAASDFDGEIYEKVMR